MDRAFHLVVLYIEMLVLKYGDRIHTKIRSCPSWFPFQVNQINTCFHLFETTDFNQVDRTCIKFKFKNHSYL